VRQEKRERERESEDPG